MINSAEIKLLVILFYVIVVYGRNPFPDSTNKAFLNDCVRQHNQYRRQHGSPDLKQAKSIVAYAKQRAHNMSTFDRLNHGHRNLRKHGENIFWGQGGNDFSCSLAVKAWYDENKRYDYSKPGFSAQTGHFTQLVWAGTTKIGCAKSSQRNNNQIETYIVCNYQSPGNVIGQFAKNVRRN